MADDPHSAEYPELDDDELLSLLIEDEAGSASSATVTTIPALGTQATLTLSHAQQRLWFLQHLDPASPAYNISTVVRIGRAVDPTQLQQALAHLVARHEVLRTSFPTMDGKATAMRHPTATVPVEVIDLADEDVSAASQAAALRPFNLSAAPLLRLTLLRSATAGVHAVLVMHHIVSDGWSMDNLVRELGTAYAAITTDRSPALPPLPIQYNDFAHWQHAHLAAGARDTQLAYWQTQLDDAPALELTTDFPRPPRPDFHGATTSFTLEAKDAARLLALASEHELTFFATALALGHAWLARLTGQDDVILGGPVANRGQPELEPLIGFFVNTLALRGRIGPSTTFRDLLSAARQTTLEGFAHQDVPFESIVKALGLERDASRNPLFQVMLTAETAAPRPLDLGDLDLTPVDLPSAVAKFDLTLSLHESAEGVAGALEYATALFVPATAARFVDQFHFTLNQCVNNPDTPLRALPLLPPAEAARVATWSRGPEPAYPTTSIPAVFAARAQATPEAVALVFAATTLTYRELEARANQMAHLLVARGVQPDQPVGLCLERSLELVVAVLGILKAGGAYLALDPTYPAERLALMLETAGATLVLSTTDLSGHLPDNAPVLALDTLHEQRAAQPADHAPDVPLTSDHLAYVSFTSGSTGTPKGVAVSHRAVFRLVHGEAFAHFGADETFLLMAPIAFDASTFELWGPLLHGGRLAILPPGTPSLEQIGAAVRTQRVTTLWLTAGLFHLMVDEHLDDLRGVRQLLAGGDVLNPALVRQVLAQLPDTRLINGYGPTENTTFTCCHPIRIEDLDHGSVPIGRAIAHTTVHVLDPNQRPVPIGVPGELHTGGDGLARGYVGRPDLTAAAFVEIRGERLYRTGDRVRWRADGVLEFLGRVDRQLKLSGHRVEPGEIEAALADLPSVSGAAVVVQDTLTGKRLIAYLAPALETDGVRAALAARLPAYAIPSVFVALPELPLNANGKIDRTALPPPSCAPDALASASPPRGDIEIAVARIWCGVLGLESIDRHANYFANGGDSIGAIQVVSRLRRAGWEIAVAELFQFPTVAQLAAHLAASAAVTSEQSASPTAGRGPVRPTPAQAWFLENVATGRAHFNQAVLLIPPAAADHDTLANAVSVIWRQHDALRTVLRADRLEILPDDTPCSLEVVDLPDESARLAATEAAHTAFDLAAGPLLRVIWQRLPDHSRLLLVAHHLVVDGVSWRLLVEDLTLVLRGESLGPRPASIASWTRATADIAARDLDYWRDVAAQAPDVWPVADASAPANGFGACIEVTARLDASKTQSLLTDPPRAYGADAEDVLLLALGRALHRQGVGAEHLIMLEGHGREATPGVAPPTHTVGWFTALHPFLLQLPEGPIGAQLKAVKEARRAIPHHGNGFAPAAYLHGDTALRDLARRAQVSFNYLGRFDDHPDQGGLRFAPESSGTPIGAEVERPHEIDATAAITGGQLGLSLLFHPERVDESTLRAVLESWTTEVRRVVEHCAAVTAPERTPSDFTSPVLSLADYEALRQRFDWSAGAIEDIARLSPMQAGMLFQSVFDESSSAYFVQMAYRLRGRLDADRFTAAWHQLAQRHTILRTSLIHEGVPEPLQVVWVERPPETAVHDVRDLSADEQRQRIAAAREADLARRFDLARDPLWRVHVWLLADDLSEIIWSYHHVLLDGWSLGLVHRDLLDLYHGRGTPTPAVPHRDYVRWLQERPPQAARDYWRNHLDGFAQPTPLPAEPDPDAAPDTRAEHLLSLDAELSAALRRLATTGGATLSTLLQATWAVLLGRLHRTDDVVFGAIVSGRPADLTGVEQMVGLFICAVPVRIRDFETKTFTELLGATQREALAAAPHHHLPIAEIQTLSAQGRDLFDHLLVFENYPIERTTNHSATDPAALAIESVEAHDRTHYEFDLTIDPGPELTLRFGHDRAVHSDAQIRRIAARLELLLRRVVATPDAPLTELDFIPKAEREWVTHELNRTAGPGCGDVTLLDLLDESRTRHADAVAVIQGPHHLTYRELHQQADQLAASLRTFDVEPGTVVGLCVGRTPAMIVGVLGILKAGAAYLPLDPLYPAERLTGMLEDAGVRLVVSTREDQSSVPPVASLAPLILLDALPPADPRPPTALRSDDLAYLIYTSGSTGRPKGVAVEHRSLVNAALAWRSSYGLDQPDAAPRILQMASLSFDVFAGDFIRALTNGGTLVLCDADTRLDPEGLVHLLREHRITQLESTPGLILPLMEHVRAGGETLPDLRMLILGSDTLRAADYAQLVRDFGAGRRILNSYGVTEATIDSSFYESTKPPTFAGNESTPIGRPMANQRCYVLDPRGRPAGIGIPGELYIGGAGLARGYHNRPDLTADRFPTLDPGDGPQRLYRTGDLARWRADGQLEFLGRSDRQVKVRGVRIEPGEIEAVLREHPAISEAVVEARPLPVHLELVAYIVTAPGHAADPAAWSAHAQSRLAAAMLPSAWVPITTLPLSPNGKVDRRALPTPESAGVLVDRATLVPPATPTEQTLAPIWQTVLQLPAVDRAADFFTLGGHSLKAMQLLSRVQRSCGVRVPMRRFFDDATLTGLARLVDAEAAATPADTTTIPLAPPADHYPLSFAQQRLWLLHHLGGETAYNMPEAYRISGDIDAAALERTIARIITRHEALRTAFVEIGGNPVQRILPAVPFALRRLDLRDQPPPAAEAEARRLADREAAVPFDLTAPPLVRATLIQLGPGAWVYLQTIHHIVGDGWSGNVLYREIFALYAAAVAGQPDPLPPLRLHYKDFACWQKTRGWAREEAHWLQTLRGAPAALALPYDFTPDGHRDFRGDHLSQTLSPAAVAALRAVARRRRTTVANTLLAVFDLLLFQLTKQADFCIGMSIANRNHPDLEHLIGFFVNLLPIRVRLDESMDFDALLDQVVTAADAAVEHQDYPFDLMVQQLNPDRASNRQPLLNIVYAFQNFADVHVDVGAAAPSPAPPPVVGPEITPFEHTFHTSKFDLTLFAEDNGTDLKITLEYDTGLFQPATIQRYLALLDRFAGMIAPSA